MPELYDFRFCSGVVREEVGVRLFVGIKDGDGGNGSAKLIVSACGVGGVKGSGGGLGITDILLSLRASVGLIVRAANPVACALFGRIDCLFADDGVVVLCRFGLPGDRDPGIEDKVLSGVWKELSKGS